MPTFVIEFDDNKREQMNVTADYLMIEGRWLQFKTKGHAVVATVPDWNVLAVRETK